MDDIITKNAGYDATLSESQLHHSYYLDFLSENALIV